MNLPAGWRGLGGKIPAFWCTLFGTEGVGVRFLLDALEAEMPLLLVLLRFWRFLLFSMCWTQEGLYTQLLGSDTPCTWLGKLVSGAYLLLPTILQITGGLNTKLQSSKNKRTPIKKSILSVIGFNFPLNRIVQDLTTYLFGCQLICKEILITEKICRLHCFSYCYK